MENSPVPVAVLLMAYGSPENMGEVAPYYTQIRHGVRPPEHLIKDLEDRYRKVGGRTPLSEITRAQASALQELLDKEQGAGKFKVFTGMKHWHPFIKDVAAEIQGEGTTKTVAIALAPHYSKISIGGYEKALQEAGFGDAVHLVESWHTNEHLIECIAEQLKAEFAKRGDEQVHVLFSAHSLPERILTWNDPYQKQLTETCELVARKIPGIEWSFSFQSAGNTGEPWLGPDINDTLLSLKEQGKKNIVVCPIGFVSDNLEIVYDLDIESQAVAREHGIHLSRTQMRNTHPLFIQALCDEAVAGAA